MIIQWKLDCDTVVRVTRRSTCWSMLRIIDKSLSERRWFWFRPIEKKEKGKRKAEIFAKSKRVIRSIPRAPRTTANFRRKLPTISDCAYPVDKELHGKVKQRTTIRRFESYRCPNERTNEEIRASTFGQVIPALFIATALPNFPK